MTAHIQFYHLTATPLERALPRLVDKAYGAGHRILLVDSVPERLELLNQLMWTYSSTAFLPHGSVSEPSPEEQPVLLAPSIDNRNNADILVVADGTVPASPGGFARILDIFDGNDAEAVTKARMRWKDYQAAGCKLSYLRQTEQGAWEEKTAESA